MAATPIKPGLGTAADALFTPTIRKSPEIKPEPRPEGEGTNPVEISVPVDGDNGNDLPIETTTEPRRRRRSSSSIKDQVLVEFKASLPRKLIRHLKRVALDKDVTASSLVLSALQRFLPPIEN